MWKKAGSFIVVILWRGWNDKVAEFCYLNSDELKERASENVQVVIWGTGRTAFEVAWTLEFLKIPLYAYADSNLVNCKKIINGKKVLNLEQVRLLENPFVLIGSFVVLPIYEKLIAAGIENVAAPLEVIKIPDSEMEKDLNFLDNTLVEMYGNIGDLVLKLGMLKALLRYFPKQHITVLVETQTNAEMIRLYTADVMVIEKKSFSEDREYRRRFLCEINSRHFSRTIVLCDARLYSNRRLLNQWNCNIREVIMNSVVPKNELLWQLDAAMLHKKFGIPMGDMEPGNAMLRETVLSVISYPVLTGRYVCIHMGATRRERHYDPVRFSGIVDHIVKSGYLCAFIGQGEYDECFVQKIFENCDKASRRSIISYVGKLTLTESFAVIARASFFIGTDSGMWNTSYVLKKSSICLYGGGEYGCFKHEAPWIHYLTISDHSCFGCRWFCTNQVPGGYSKCMDGISEEEIIFAVDRKIAEDAGASYLEI